MYKIDVYDFDGTIYDGDSSIDFFLYAIKKKKSLVKYFPIIIISMIMKYIGLISTKKFKETFFLFVKEFNNLEEMIEEFWQKNEFKIKKFFLDNIQKNEENYVISASPEFLLKPYISKFENVKLIATKFDENGKIIGENCKGEEKVKLLKKAERNFEINNFYTDSLADLPLVNIAKNSFYVHRNNVERWKK